MKAANRNLLLLSLPALLIAAAGILLFVEGGNAFRLAQQSMPPSPGSDVGDVEGYAFLLGLIGSGLGQFAALLYQLAGFLIAGYGVLLLALGLVGRALFKPTAGRLLAYRIVTGLHLALMLLPVPLLAEAFFKSVLALAPRAELALPLLLLALPPVFVIRTTYTQRIAAPAAAPDR